MGIKHDDHRINKFLDKICGYVKFKDAHNSIKLEVRNHIEEKTLDYIDEGLKYDEAVDKVIKEMGSEEVIGKQFDKVYKKRIDIKFLILSFALVFIGIACNSVLYVRGYTEINPIKMFINFIFGAAMVIGLYMFNYKRIQNYSKIIYGLSTIVVLASNLWFFEFFSMKASIINLILIMYVISLCGILINSDDKKTKNILYIIFLYFIPAMTILLTNDVGYFIIFSITFIAVLCICGYNKKYILSIVFTGLGIVSVCAFSSNYARQRIVSYFNYKNELNGLGYIYEVLCEMWACAKCLGKGTLEGKINLPSSHSEFIFTYITYNFGWLVSLAVIAIIIMFLARMYNLGNRVKDNYGKAIVKSFSILLGIQFLFNIIINLGIFPIMGISLPFISYGGSSTAINLIIIGIVMSAYRRKDLVIE